MPSLSKEGAARGRRVIWDFADLQIKRQALDFFLPRLYNKISILLTRKSA